MTTDPERTFEDADRILDADKVHFLKGEFPRSNFVSVSEWTNAIIKEIASALMPAAKPCELPELDIPALMRSSETVWGDIFEQDIALDERLEAMIDRAVKRLIQIKAMKQMLEQTGGLRAGQEQGKMIERKVAN